MRAARPYILAAILCVVSMPYVVHAQNVGWAGITGSPSSFTKGAADALYCALAGDGACAITGAITVGGATNVFGSSAAAADLALKINSATKKAHLVFSGSVVGISDNLTYDGTNWNLDDTSTFGTVFYFNDSTSVFSMATATAGSNPRTLTNTMTWGGGAGVMTGSTGTIGVTSGNIQTQTGYIYGGHIGTWTNCADTAGAAACAASASGAAGIDDGGTTVVVSTTAVNAASRIFLQWDSSLTDTGTCNTTPVTLTVTARTAGTSFTVTQSADPAGANRTCFSYFILN